ncbi:MAG: S-methyl-5-thioribose-1-phosphate isomerase [Dehalococcoidia bacterium]|jgi:methylthioribose-1-phosphate isomerase|nr:S-methyl-5-thioribose-1-phosphate isomerase [Dehalococcoidia bacterium]
MTEDALYRPVSWRDGRLRLLDQTLLPNRVEYREIASLDAAVEAISSMRVRGAPAIGIAAAYALAAIARDGGRGAVEEAAPTLAATRPTAVNLRWAVDRVLARVIEAASSADVAGIALDEARRIHEEQREADARMAADGASLLDQGSALLTHCNTGPLATGGRGTALAVVIEAHRRGLVSDVFVDETRPRLQGAHLTTWELAQHGIPHRLIADSAAASIMARGAVSAVFTGADRIAHNGDTANKIGTYSLAVVAGHHEVPFYIVAPTSTIDPQSAGGGAIAIEQRDEAEVLTVGNEALTPDGTRALNPAFDVTPASLITAIVTELGVLRPPYLDSISEALTGSVATA